MRVQWLGRKILSILIYLEAVACPHILDVVAFHGEPIVADSHNFLSQQGSTSMGSKQTLMVSLRGIYASKQRCVVVPFVQYFPNQEKLACHALDEFPLVVYDSRRVSTIFDIGIDIMVPWLPINFSFDVHAFFIVHVVGWQATDLYAQLSHVISFYQHNHASQGG